MPRFSLIIATVERTIELERFLASLADQHYSDYEVIVIDQNDDNRLESILDEWLTNIPAHSRPLNLAHIRCQRGLSRARNRGLEVAKGEIVAFPDDDCWYASDTLRTVDQWFAGHPKYHILSVTAKDENGVRSGNRWVTQRCDLAGINIFRTTFSCAMFVRREDRSWILRFDETIGVGAGTSFGSGEDTDFVLRLMKQGMKGHFTSEWHVGHPCRDMLSGTVTTRRAAGYGAGMGHVLRKHSMPLLGSALVMYDFIRAGVVLVQGRRAAAALSLAHGRGIISGYFAVE